jgi:3-oxoacyl-[acyl-carrier protein] reductase
VGLSGKRALVIGGGGGGDGIGRAITRAFGEKGARVVVADVDQRRASVAAVELGDHGHPLVVDVRSLDELVSMVDSALEWLGGLDVLVTVVGGQVAFVPAVPLHEMADQDWDTMYELNLRYVARTLRIVLAEFLKQGSGGTIISVGSVTGFMAAPNQGAYGVMKAGLVSLSKTVAAEYSPNGIRMNVVTGGAIATTVSANTEAGEWIDEVPSGRYGTTDEIAAAAVFLASDESAYMTGQQIILDGGVSVRGPFDGRVSR